MGRLGPHPAAVSRTSEAARQARTPGEWTAVGDPESARRRTAELLTRETPVREEAVRQGFESAYAAYTRRDWELNTLLLDENITFLPGDVGQKLPGGFGEYHGVEGYLPAQDQLLEVWADFQLELQGIAACDETTVTTLIRFTGSGGRSGVGIDNLGVSHHLFRDGLVVEQTFWFDRAAGLTALGLETRPPASSA